MAIERLTKVNIKGFKSIRELKLELKPFNVLIGANGSGKSNFISFFRMLNYMFGSTQGNLQQFVKQEGEASSLLFYGPGATRNIEAQLTFDGDQRWSEYEFDLAWGQGEKLFFVGESWRFQRDSDSAPISRPLGSPHDESKVLAIASQTTDSPYRKEAKLFRERLRRIRQYHFHNTSPEAYIRLGQDLKQPSNYLKSDGGNLWVFLYNLKERKPAHYKRILATVQLVAPFIQDFVLEPSTFNPRSLMMGWVDRSGEEFGPHQLSDGTLRAIALITALMQPEENMPSIMLFDEPELGLHPAAIGLVSGLLKATSLKRQVIVATQSPTLIKEYEPSDIIVLDRHESEKGRGESQFTQLDAESLGTWLDRFNLGQLYEMNVTGGGAQ